MGLLVGLVGARENHTHTMSIAELRFPVIGISQCEVCGSDQVQVDEVQSAGRLLLAECGRCDHKWTGRVASPRVLHPAPQPDREAARGVRSGARAEVATAA